MGLHHNGLKSVVRIWAEPMALAFVLGLYHNGLKSDVRIWAEPMALAFVMVLHHNGLKSVCAAGTLAIKHKTK